MNTLNGYSKSTLSDDYLLKAGGGHIAVGNTNGSVPLNNGTLNVNLNADLVDGSHIYERKLGINGTEYIFASTYTTGVATTIYAPTSKGTNNQICASTGGIPTWINQSAITAGSSAKVTVAKTNDDKFRPFVVTNEATPANLYYTDKAKLNYATGAIETSGQITANGFLSNKGDITLISSSGDSPKLNFIRGGSVGDSGGLWDWRMYVASGHFYLQADQGTGSWTTELFINTSHNVGIGTTSPGAKLHVNAGLIRTTCNAKTLTIGSQNKDWCHYDTDAPCHWFNTKVEVNGSHSPHVNNSFSSGTSSKRWSNVYSVLGNYSGALTLSGTTADTAILQFSRSGASTWNYIIWPGNSSTDCKLAFGYSNSSAACYYYMTSAALYPTTDNTVTLGTSSYKWSTIYGVTVNINGKANIDSYGRYTPLSTSYRNAGIYGIYDSTKIGHVWSIGTSYSILADGSNTNNMYGLVYFHTNWSNSSTYNDASKTEVSTYAGGHQIALVSNGKVQSSLGELVWSRYGFIKNGSSDNYVLLGGGGHKTISSFQTTYDGRYVLKTGDTMTGSLTMTVDTGIYGNGKGILASLSASNTWDGVASYACTVVGAINNPLVIRTSGDNLEHFNKAQDKKYKIWDAFNSNVVTVSWAASQYYVGSTTKYIGTDSDQSDIWIRCGSTYMLNCTETEKCVRRGQSATDVTLGSSTYPWKGLYSGTGSFTGDITLHSGNVDRFITFSYNNGTTYSWRLGYLGSGSGDTNYFVVQSAKAAGTSWNNVIRLGNETLDAAFGGHIILNTNKSLQKTGSSVSWYQGRNNAIIKTTSYSGYNALVSMKTTDGDWSMGVYSNNIMYFTYITDTNYNAGTNTTTAQVYINPSGNVYATHFYEHSDVNLKSNIKSITTSDNIPQLKSFDWKSDGSHSYGLIAQELEEMGYSELVSNEGGQKTVKYSAALSLIVGKLQVKIRELEKEIENLKNKN